MDLTDIARKLHRSELVGRPMRELSKRYGENIYKFSSDWDILLIFDAAHYDIVNSIKSEYEYIEDVKRIKSRGSKSSEWTQNTFITDFDKYESDIRNTHYITDNFLTTFVLSGIHEKQIYKEQLNEESIEELIGDLGDESVGYRKYLDGFYPVCMDNLENITGFRPPKLVSNKTQEVIESIDDNDRVISHYMMPHEPFVNDLGEDTAKWPNSMENRTMFNLSDDYYNRLKFNYRENHKYIFNHIRKLLRQIPEDYNVIITSDHANIMNRFLGMAYTLGHPEYFILPRQLRNVPWITVNQSHVDDGDNLGDVTETDDSLAPDKVRERLENLGYM